MTERRDEAIGARHPVAASFLVLGLLVAAAAGGGAAAIENPPSPSAAGAATATPPERPAGGVGVAARPAVAAASLRLVPLSGEAVVLGAGDLERMPRVSLKVPYPAGPDHQMRPAEVSGVAVRALLDRIGVPSGHDIHGDALRLYVVAEGADGYRVVLALAELDPGFTDQTVLVADRVDGRPLGAAEGPWRLVVPMDKRPARWVRQLVRIAVRREP